MPDINNLNIYDLKGASYMYEGGLLIFIPIFFFFFLPPHILQSNYLIDASIR